MIVLVLGFVFYGFVGAYADEYGACPKGAGLFCEGAHSNAPKADPAVWVPRSLPPPLPQRERYELVLDTPTESVLWRYRACVLSPLPDC